MLPKISSRALLNRSVNFGLVENNFIACHRWLGAYRGSHLHNHGLGMLG
jgi:hypothetical protein